MQISAQLLEDLDRLYNNPEFRRVREWMRETQEEYTKQAIKAAKDPDVARGRAWQQMDLTELFDTAPEQLRRLEKRTNGYQKPHQTRYPGSS